MFTGIHHAAVVVRNLEESIRFYRDVLGLPLGRCETVEEQGVRAALFPLAHGELELLEPVNPAGGVARFLEKRGEGLHHLCIASTDIDGDLAAAKAAGLPLIDQAPRQGLAGRIGFLHPNASQGVLVEVAQPPVHAAGLAVGGGIRAISLEVVYVGVKDPGEAAGTFVRNFAGRQRAAIRDRRLGIPAVAVQLGATDVMFLAVDDVPSAPFLGRADGLLGVRLSVQDLDAARHHLASAGAAAAAVSAGPERLLRLDVARTNGMNLFLA